MDSTFKTILKAGLTLVTGWVVGAMLLLSLAVMSQKALAEDSTLASCEAPESSPARQFHAFPTTGDDSIGLCGGSLADLGRSEKYWTAS